MADSTSPGQPNPTPRDGEILAPEPALIAAERGGSTPGGIRDEQLIVRESPAFLRTVLSLFAAGFSTFALLYSVQPMMPVFAHAFDLKAAASSLVLSVSTAGLAFGLLFVGPISDAVGRKNVMVLSLLGATACMLASVASPTWGLVLVLRGLLGVCLSGFVAVAMTYLSEEIHPKDLGFAMGLYIGGNGLGGMLGRLIAGVLVDFLSWRVTLAILGVLTGCVTLIFWRIVPASRHFRPVRHNVGSLVRGFSVHLRDSALRLLFLEGFLLMGGFVTLFNYVTYRLLSPPYDLSQAAVGCIPAVYFGGIYSSARMGALADRYGRRRVLWVIICVMIGGLLITLADPLWALLAGMVFFSAGFFGAHSVASSWVGRRALTARGQASSLYLLSYYVGGSVAGTAGGVFWHSHGWPGVVVFIGGILALSLLISLRLIRIPPLEAALARARS